MSLTLDRPPPVARASHRRRPHTPAWLRLPWPLALILGVQIALSLRLIWTNTAFQDEATYLYAGSQELRHWLHGTPVEDYQTFFSGSPHIYPPIGAIANALGGLAGARLLGLMFMMGATVLLYITTTNLFDRRSGYLAAALFTALGVTQFLSAFATYDPMALFLLALSAYLVIGRRHDWESLSNTLLLGVAAPAMVALDNATKYATALWDPVLIGLVMCAPALSGHNWREGLGAAARFTGTLGAIVGFALFGIGKQKYEQGILDTTVMRSSKLAPGMGQSAFLVFADAWNWIWLLLVCVILGMGIIGVTRRSSPLVVVGVLLLCASVAAPLNQARIGTTVSLQKHVVYGAWFGCILAGYGLRRALNWRTPVAVGIFGLLGAGSLYYTAQATILFQGWSHENPEFVRALGSLLRPGAQRYLIEGYSDIPAYYEGPAISSMQWKEAGTYSYTDPKTGQFFLNGPAFADAIRHRVFTLIILNFTRTGTNEPANDYSIQASIKKYGGYHFVTYLPPSDSASHASYTVWALDGVSNP